MKKKTKEKEMPQPVTQGMPQPDAEIETRSEDSPEALADRVEMEETAATLAGPEDEASGNGDTASYDGAEKKGDVKPGADGRLEKYFGRYPATMALLGKEPDLKITGETAAFVAMTEGYARGSGVSDETLDACLAMLFGIAAAGSRGGFGIDQLETVMKGLSHDRTLAEATAAAELRGRNAAIDERMPDDDDDASDGLPGLGAAMTGASAPGNSIFSLARGAR